MAETAPSHPFIGTPHRSKCRNGETKKEKRYDVRGTDRHPLAAGRALAAGLGRARRGAVPQYARAPLTTTAIVALAGFCLIASANAMFLQAHHHPAPLFGQATQEVADVAPVPVTPAMRPKPATQVVAPVQTTGSLPALPTDYLDLSATTKSSSSRSS